MDVRSYYGFLYSDLLNIDSSLLNTSLYFIRQTFGFLPKKKN
jgi:hypothetical protein